MTSGSKAILIVEDDADLRFFMNAALKRNGFTTVEAANGVEALDLIEQSEPALVILDMKMPVMNGWEFARLMREKFGKHIPIIVSTAAQDPASRAQDVDAAAWLAKPFSVADLVTTVNRHIRR
jgi:DNA-binding response OmpR family regulator